MAEEKKGLFNLIKGIARSSNFAEEEKFQRNYALSKEEDPQISEIANEITEKEPISQAQWENDELVSFCKDKLQIILDLSGFNGNVEVKDKTDDYIEMEILNTNDPGRIIGKDGATLDSLQIIIKSFVYQKFDRPLRITIDAGDYKKRRMEGLRADALRASKMVIQRSTKEDLAPMNAAERREIHMLFQDDDKVRTFSVGEGSYRHVVIEKRRDGSSL